MQEYVCDQYRLNECLAELESTQQEVQEAEETLLPLRHQMDDRMSDLGEAKRLNGEIVRKLQVRGGHIE